MIETKAAAKIWARFEKRCQKASGPDFRLDGDIAEALNLPPVDAIRMSDFGSLWLRKLPGASGQWTAPHFSGSFDVVKALIRRTLPGWAHKCGTCSVSDDAWIVPDFNDPIHGERLMREFGPFPSGSIWDTGIDIDRRPSGHEELALLEAYCSARVAIAQRHIEMLASE